MIIVGITGTSGAGKSTVAHHLRDYGFAYYGVRDFISVEVEKRGLIVSRDTTVAVGNELREKYGHDYIMRSLYERAQKEGVDVVIESVRALGELRYLRTQNNFVLISVDAPHDLRYRRVHQRRSSHDRISFDEFLQHEQREEFSLNPGRQSLRDVMAEADFFLTNDRDEKALRVAVNDTVAQIHNRIKAE
jgi:dephospho-CoA kinase